jgi:hypothetical protein
MAVGHGGVSVVGQGVLVMGDLLGMGCGVGC